MFNSDNQCSFDIIILYHHYENKDGHKSALQNDEQLGMRSRDPIILKEVKKSVLESLLIFAFLLCIAKINIGAYSEFAKETYRFIDIETKWRLHCVDADPKDWGQYCHRLKSRIKPYPVLFLVESVVAVLITATLLSFVCAELVLEIQARSLQFQEWYWDDYNFQWSRVMSHGG